MVSVSVKNYIENYRPCCTVCGKQVYTYDKYEWSKLKGRKYAIAHKDCLKFGEVENCTNSE